MSNLSLFPEIQCPPAAIREQNEALVHRLSGLIYEAEFITPQEEADLLARVDQEPWLNELQRRVQHYGYKYDYRSRRIDESMRVGSVPEWMTILSARLLSVGYIAELPVRQL